MRLLRIKVEVEEVGKKTTVKKQKRSMVVKVGRL